MNTPTTEQTTDLDAAEPPAEGCTCAPCAYEAYNAKYGRLRWVIIHPDLSELPPQRKHRTNRQAGNGQPSSRHPAPKGNTMSTDHSGITPKSEESARIAMREAGFSTPRTNLDDAMDAFMAYQDAARTSQQAGRSATLPQILATLRAEAHSTRVASTLTGDELTAFTKFMHATDAARPAALDAE